MNVANVVKKLVRGLIAIICFAATAAAAQSAEPPRAKVTQIFSESMMEWPGKQVRSFIVEFPPGGESVPHTHPGPIFAYVLRGTWIMQMEGLAERTVRAGEVAYEHAHHKHLISRNASTSEPLQLLVYFISEPGAPVSVPIPAGK